MHECLPNPPVNLCVVTVLLSLMLIFTAIELIRLKPPKLSVRKFARWNPPLQFHYSALVSCLTYQVFTLIQAALTTCGIYQESSILQIVISTPAMMFYTTFETITLFASLYRFERMETILRGTRRYALLQFSRGMVVFLGSTSVIFHIFQLFYKDGIIPILYITFTTAFSTWVPVGDAYCSTRMSITVLKTASLGERVNKKTRWKAMTGIRYKLGTMLAMIAVFDLFGICLFLVDENMRLLGVVIAVGHSITSFRLLRTLKQGLESAKKQIHDLKLDHSTDASNQIQEFGSSIESSHVDSSIEAK